MTEKEIDLLLKGFKNHVNKLLYCEEELVDIKLLLKGIRRVKAKNGIEEAHPDGTKIYKNSIISLEDKLIEVRRERNYHLYAVKRVMHMLRMLDDEEVELLEMYYWDELSVRTIAEMLDYSKSRVQQKIDTIIQKIGHVQRKNGV